MEEEDSNTEKKNDLEEEEDSDDDHNLDFYGSDSDDGLVSDANNDTERAKDNVAEVVAVFIDHSWIYEYQAKTPPIDLLNEYPNVLSAVVFSMGDVTKEAGMTQEAVNYLFNQWQTYREKDIEKNRKRCAKNLV